MVKMLFILIVCVMGMQLEAAISIQQEVEEEAKRIIGKDKEIAVWVGVVNGKEKNVYGVGKKGSKGGIVRIGSLTQGMTAMMLARVIERGMVKSDAVVQDYVPEGVWLPTYNGRQMTLIDLATHTSGLPDLPPDLRFVDDYKTYSRKQFFEFLKGVKLTRMPGEKVKFSRVGYALLGMVIERITKKSWVEFFDQEIKSKLRIVDTGIDLSKNQKKRFLWGRNEEGKKIDSLEVFSADSPFIGSQGLFSDLNDLMNWTEYFLGEGGSDLNFLIPIMLGTCRRIERDDDYCLGFKMYEKQGEKTYFLQSMQFGFGIYLGFIPEEQVGVVIVANKSVSLAKMGMRLLTMLKNEKAS
jgi:CubicO group peptidase (beta-lactamase class C family)